MLDIMPKLAQRGTSFCRRLLKAVVLGAESDGEEAIDDVVQEHMRLLLQPAPVRIRRLVEHC